MLEDSIMIALKRILVPTDFSETSLSAIRYARALAEAFGASIDYLHVVEDAALYGWTGDGYIPDLNGLREGLRKGAQTQLEKIVSECGGKSGGKTVTKYGNPFLEIVRYAKEYEIDLIILGTHGRGAIAHMLMGSVAEKVVRKAPCPVLTVRHPEHEFVMP
jgi:nucleotide-binding universal stress UspA family protein